MYGLNAMRREAIRAEVERLSSGLQTTWALKPDTIADPLAKVRIYLRTAGSRDIASFRGRTLTDDSKLQTVMAQEAVHEVEIRIVSYDPDLEAHEVAARLSLRFWRGTSTERLNAIGLAFLNLGDRTELPGETEDEMATSVCLCTLKLGAMDVDTTIDGFDTWIETADIPPPVRTPASDEVTGT